MNSFFDRMTGWEWILGNPDRRGFIGGGITF
jgi:hypothetical protein